MKRILPYLFIIALVMTTLACGLTAPASPPPTEPETLPTRTESPPTSASLPPTPLPPSETPTFLPPTPAPTALPPTETLLPTPTPPTSHLAATRVQFAAGGTWTELEAAGRANQATTFVLGAAQGQVMGVSIFEGPGYSLTITGADGTLLTPPNTDAYFWRGTLPATQDYLVSILAPNDGDFTLRVAINPPGQSEQTFTYSDENVSLTYSDSFAPVLYPYNFLQRDHATLALTVLDQTFYEKTNLGEAYFVLNLFTDADAVTNCYQPYYEGEQAEGQATFNGLTFEKSTGIGVGAGNIYEQIIYRTVQNNACMEVVFFMHYGNIGNYPPEIKEFDRDALIQMFEEVLGTLTIE